MHRPTLAFWRLQKKQQLPQQAISELTHAYHFCANWNTGCNIWTIADANIAFKFRRSNPVATAMGFDYAGFMQQLDIHRRIDRHFDLIFATPEITRPRHAGYLWQAEQTPRTEAAATQLSTLGFAEPAKISNDLRCFIGLLSPTARISQQQINTLVPMLIGGRRTAG